jgi:excisionase family DNA binding protein
MEKEDVIDQEGMLTIPDVAGLLRCTDRHVYNLRKRGEIPQPVKLGENVRWPREVIAQWIRDGCPAIAV